MARGSAVLVALPLALLAACATKPASDTQGPAKLRSHERAGAVVVVRNLDFKPHSVTIRAGQVVVWQFDDGGVPHNVKGDAFRSAVFRGGIWSRRFETAGTFDYICTIHDFMHGSVVVR
jgi:plastocyanin